MVKLPLWDNLRFTIEGRQGMYGCTLEDGELKNGGLIPRKSKPDLKILAEYLRSDIPITREMRNWLADLMDEDATSDFQFKELKKRKHGAPNKGPTANWDIAYYVRDLVEKGETKQRAIGSAIKKFGVEDSTIQGAMSSLKEALEEDEKNRRRGDYDYLPPTWKSKFSWSLFLSWQRTIVLKIHRPLPKMRFANICFISAHPVKYSRIALRSPRERNMGKINDMGSNILAEETSRIRSDPKVCRSKPCIRSMRIRVSDILDMLAGGATRKEILADYPYLKDEDITAALEFAAHQSDHLILQLA